MFIGRAAAFELARQQADLEAQQRQQRRVQQLINEGVLLGQKFGDRWMVSESSVLEYKQIREQRQAKGQAEDN